MLTLLLLTLDAHAATACVADDICAPGANPCVIAADWDVLDGCILDFGTRAVQVTAAGTIDAGTGTVDILAGTFTALASSDLQARGTGATGGTLRITTTGDFVSQAAVDASSDWTGGTVSIMSTGGAIRLLSGAWTARGRVVDADGGTIALDAFGDVYVASALDVYSGSEATGGSIELTAGGRIEVVADLDAHGGEYDGGEITVLADGDVVLGAVLLNVSGGGAGGYGGAIDLTAGGSINSLALLRSNGSAGGGWAGDGGDITLSAGLNLSQGALVRANGTAPDGWGGVLELTAGGNLQCTGALEAVGPGTDSSGGDLTLFAGGSIDLQGNVDVTGGTGGGGAVFVEANGDVVLDGSMLSDGSGDGDGGSIELLSTGGRVEVRDLIRARGGAAGYGGTIDVEGCEVSVPVGGQLNTDRLGGVNQLTGRDALTIAGSLRAASSNRLTYRVTPPVIAAGAIVLPTATLVADPTLTTCVCIDDDGDGVCNPDDLCPGHPDGQDLDGDGTPDGCEVFSLLAPSPGTAGSSNTWLVTDAPPGATVHLVFGVQAGATPVPGCPGLTLGLAFRQVVGTTTANAQGRATFTRTVPATVSGLTARFQAVLPGSCEVSPVVVHAFP